MAVLGPIWLAFGPQSSLNFSLVSCQEKGELDFFFLMVKYLIEGPSSKEWDGRTVFLIMSMCLSSDHQGSEQWGLMPI